MQPDLNRCPRGGIWQDAVCCLASPRPSLAPTRFSLELEAGNEAVCLDAAGGMRVVHRSVPGPTPGQSHLTSLLLTQECCNQQVDSKPGGAGKPLWQEISK